MRGLGWVTLALLACGQPTPDEDTGREDTAPVDDTEDVGDTDDTAAGGDTDDTDSVSCVPPEIPEAGVALPGVDPEGVRVGPDCGLYLTETDTVWRILPGATPQAAAFASHDGFTNLQGLVFGPDGSLYVASRDADAIGRFNGATGAFIDLFATGAFDGPNVPLFGPDGHLYVSSRNTDAIERFDGSTGESLGTFATHAQLDSPEGMVFGPDGHLYVSSRSTSLVLRFDGTTGAYDATILDETEVDSPEGLGFTSDGALWVASRDSAEVLRLTPGTLTVAERIDMPDQGRPVGLEVGPDDAIYVVVRETGRLIRVRSAPTAR